LYWGFSQKIFGDFCPKLFISFNLKMDERFEKLSNWAKDNETFKIGKDKEELEQKTMPLRRRQSSKSSKTEYTTFTQHFKWKNWENNGEEDAFSLEFSSQKTGKNLEW
jgi:hypothetical protein